MSRYCRYAVEVGSDDKTHNRNRLRVELGPPAHDSLRCLAQPPTHWPDGTSGLRWLRSGGSPLVFGSCIGDICSERTDADRPTEQHIDKIVTYAADAAKGE
jgi:hypothetical protein